MITPNVWIYGFDKKKEEIIALHKKLQTISNFETEIDADDDLPNFLKSLSFNELDRLINSIESNSVDIEDAHVKMYTVHSFKGMEDDYIRIANDVSIEQSENLYYVAITRGMLEIVIDNPSMNHTPKLNTNKRSITSKYFVQNSSNEEYTHDMNTDTPISDISFDMMMKHCSSIV
jgi:superfamily I DNA/RNA helicase